VLHESGCRGRLTSGRIERVGKRGLNVYDTYGNLFEYLSGDALRSWCVFNDRGLPVEDWCNILPGDMEEVVSYARHLSEKTPEDW
jgi:hypothetical protein